MIKLWWEHFWDKYQVIEEYWIRSSDPVPSEILGAPVYHTIACSLVSEERIPVPLPNPEVPDSNLKTFPHVGILENELTEVQVSWDVNPHLMSPIEGQLTNLCRRSLERKSKAAELCSEPTSWNWGKLKATAMPSFERKIYKRCLENYKVLQGIPS